MVVSKLLIDEKIVQEQNWRNEGQKKQAKIAEAMAGVKVF